MLDAKDTTDLNRTPLTNNPIEQLRKQAKQRFIGASVLLLIAVVGLPFLLDSQPRPLASKVSIDIPTIDSKQELLPEVPAPQPTTPTPAAAPAAVLPPPTPLVFAPTADAPATNDAPPAPKNKFIVQAGTFSDPSKLQAITSRLDKAGIKHYTQAGVGKDGSPRTRIRLKGAFSTKEEANAAAAQVAKLGIPVIVLKP
jgi:DedD protein